MLRDVQTDKNRMEEIRHESHSFPFRVDYGNIHDFLNRQVRCHWHRDLEFLLIHSGRMHCKANDQEYLMRTGDCVFFNTNVLHLCWAAEDSDCVYSSIAVTPSIFGPERSGLRRRYVDAVLGNHSFDSYHFQRAGGWQDSIIDSLYRMDAVYRLEREECFELEILSLLFHTWSVFFRQIKPQLDDTEIPSGQVKTLKTMLSYIQEHYAESITLDDIAGSAGISKSSCSHIFKSYMHKSPFEYLMRYRIEMSLPHLVSGEVNITETALAAGFSSGSYYTEVFKRFMGVPPLTYRKTAGKK